MNCLKFFKLRFKPRIKKVKIFDYSKMDKDEKKF